MPEETFRKSADTPLSDRERALIERLFKWENLPPSLKAAMVDYLSMNGSLHVSNMPTLKGEDWVVPTLVNSWTDVGGWITAAYCKDVLGWVHQRGILASPAGAGTGNGTVAWTYPAGYRPSAKYPIPATGSSAGAANSGRCEINTDGTMVPVFDGLAANQAVAFIVISGSFRAA